MQNVAAEAEFCVSKGDHAAGIAVKAVHDFFHRKSVKIQVKLFDEKRRQTRSKRLRLLCPSPAWALRCPCPIGSHLPDSRAYQGPAGRPAVQFLVRNVK